MAVRKNASKLLPADWTALIAALRAIRPAGGAFPVYEDFVAVHMRAMDRNDSVAMKWQVHSMRMPSGMVMPGVNFLAWHRCFLLRMEKRLQAVDPSVSLPYWDATVMRSIPAPLDHPALVAEFGITRDPWAPNELATPDEETHVVDAPTFRLFQQNLEVAVHGGVHNAVGGTMSGGRSPADPLFFLHHANIDRLWSVWQAAHLGLGPANMKTALKPKPLLDRTVAAVQDIAKLGYSYA